MITTFQVLVYQNSARGAQPTSTRKQPPKTREAASVQFKRYLTLVSQVQLEELQETDVVLT
jgi:hypothetical protein